MTTNQDHIDPTDPLEIDETTWYKMRIITEREELKKELTKKEDFINKTYGLGVTSERGGGGGFSSVVDRKGRLFTNDAADAISDFLRIKQTLHNLDAMYNSLEEVHMFQ